VCTDTDSPSGGRRPHLRIRSQLPGVLPMMDLLFIAIAVAFFLAAWGLSTFLGRL
jgi:hypothetical protein